jgi:hypothetical protein
MYVGLRGLMGCEEGDDSPASVAPPMSDAASMSTLSSSPRDPPPRLSMLVGMVDVVDSAYFVKIIIYSFVGNVITPFYDDYAAAL